MRVEEIKVYTFDELGEEVQQKVVNKVLYDYYDMLVNSDTLEECMKYKLEEKGYNKMNVEFNLSNSQGDYARFYGELDHEEFIKLIDRLDPTTLSQIQAKRLKSIIKELRVGLDIEPRGNYDVYVEIDDNFDGYDRITSLFDRVIECIESDIKDMFGELESLGYDYIDDCESREHIEDYIEGNEMEFLEDGTIWG